MKTNLNRILTIVAIGLVAVCASPAPAAAQDAYNGRFTLTEDVRWSQAVLPAGEYTLSLKSASVPAQIILHGPNGFALVMTSTTDTKNSHAASSITVERVGGMRVVRDLYLAELGMDLRYSAPKLPHNEIAQGPRTTEQVLVAMTTK
jgi:hypothetical protein